MESSSLSTSLNFVSYWNYLNLLLIRPVFAIFFVLSFIFLWWWLAWKSILVHVPLVQEIFGLRKKQVKPKPPTRRLSRYYNSINSQNSTSQCKYPSADPHSSVPLTPRRSAPESLSSAGTSSPSALTSRTFSPRLELSGLPTSLKTAPSRAAASPDVMGESSKLRYNKQPYCSVFK